jgi:hypothetical protein
VYRAGEREQLVGVVDGALSAADGPAAAARTAAVFRLEGHRLTRHSEQ